jgi:hypothetical protein
MRSILMNPPNQTKFMIKKNGLNHRLTALTLLQVSLPVKIVLLWEEWVDKFKNSACLIYNKNANFFLDVDHNNLKWTVTGLNFLLLTLMELFHFTI